MLPIIAIVGLGVILFPIKGWSLSELSAVAPIQLAMPALPGVEFMQGDFTDTLR